ncbi:AbrB/MazE/SpoVT family DNA-binding domain-containing protein [Lentibacillus sediminis]|uniref:AbrB/MazE/SpoVT family DNA-binding domain-containing protein n=1 Tax=Lentibacillus sediminis TaxID=1940529 RepID=UPI000C1C6412|nr:AbrB/MazE/SpoVT family DNA-binding domain-containing protein [Lentibacillus sediminis]
MITTAQKWDDSIWVRIPEEIAEKYGIREGLEVEVNSEEQGIIIKPINQEPTLKELLAKCTPENQHEEIDWGKPEGKEIW